MFVKIFDVGNYASTSSTSSSSTTKKDTTKEFETRFDRCWLSGIVHYTVFQFRGSVSPMYTSTAIHNYIFTNIPNSYVYLVTSAPLDDRFDLTLDISGVALVRLVSTPKYGVELIVDLLCVRKSFELGTRVITTLCETAKQKFSCRVVSLHSIHDKSVQEFYKKCDFVIDRRVRNTKTLLKERGEIPLVRHL